MNNLEIRRDEEWEKAAYLHAVCGVVVIVAWTECILDVEHMVAGD